MAVALALAAAACWGISDFAAGLASKRSAVLFVTILVYASGLGILLPAAMLSPVASIQQGILWGVLAGISGTAGALVFYAGLARGDVAVISPVAAVVGAAVPVTAGLARGERPTGPALVGVVAGLVAVSLIGSGKRRADGPPLRISLALAFVSGAAFGIYFVLLAQAPHDSGLWPLLGSGIASIIVVAVSLCAAGGERRMESGSTRLAVLGGLLEASANVFYLHAVRGASLALVAMVCSLYPAVTVLLAVGVLRERPGPLQLMGIGVALVAVLLIAAGSAP